MPDLIDGCEYNPTAKRAAYENEVHAEATILVGANGQWRLCESCANLPEFKRLTKRKPIIRRSSNPTEHPK